MLEIYMSIISSLVSAILGVNLKDIKRTLNKEKLKNSGNLEISQNIDAVSKKLEDSKEIIETALVEMEKQKLFMKWSVNIYPKTLYGQLLKKHYHIWMMNNYKTIILAICWGMVMIIGETAHTMIFSI